MSSQRLIAATLSRAFRSMFVMRQKRARALDGAAKALHLATRGDLETLRARADLALGRARRFRDDSEDAR